MATWITHLRVAQGVMDKNPGLDAEGYVLGNIAPDSGVPNADGAGFTPPSAVSHFDESYGRKKGAVNYAAQHLQPEQLRGCDRRSLSFHLGYISHLMTDALWRERIAVPSVEKFGHLFESCSAGEAWGQLKRDWYGQDFLFLEQHPDFTAWRIYAEMKDILNRWLDIFSEDAFLLRREYITGFYTMRREDLEREYQYLSQAELDAFVIFASGEISARLKPFMQEGF